MELWESRTHWSGIQSLGHISLSQKSIKAQGPDPSTARNSFPSTIDRRARLSLHLGGLICLVWKHFEEEINLFGIYLNYDKRSNDLVIII